MPSLIEGIKDNPILILGATGAIGSLIAQRLAVLAFDIHLGTRGGDRSRERFAALSTRITKSNGTVPQPFYADLAQEKEVVTAAASLRIPEGQPVDVFAIAAEGLNFYKLSLAKAGLSKLRSNFGNGKLRIEDLIEATPSIKQVVLKDGVIDKARGSNTKGSLRVLEQLVKRGNITRDSVVVTLSSSESDDTDPGNINSHTGPFFYLPVGVSKKEQVLTTAELANEFGFSYVDIVAPMVKDTDVGDWGQQIIKWEESVVKDMPKVPLISLEGTVSGSINVFLGVKRSAKGFERDEKNFQRWYLRSFGLPSKQRPASWPKPSLPYL